MTAGQSDRSIGFPRLTACEETIFWRHHGVVLPDGKLAAYYSSRPYGHERIRFLEMKASL